jgi:hypothetical protein
MQWTSSSRTATFSATGDAEATQSTPLRSVAPDSLTPSSRRESRRESPGLAEATSKSASRLSGGGTVVTNRGAKHRRRRGGCGRRGT